MTVSARPRWPATLWRLGAGLATGLCVVAVPLALVAGNVRGVTLDQRFYLAEFARYDVGSVTGLTSTELRMVAEAFVDYFQAPPGRLNVQLARGGTMLPLFNARELAHMEDVQALMHLVFRVQGLALGYAAAYAAVGFAWRRARFVPVAGWVLLAGAGLTVALLVVLGGLALTSFSELFLQFHLISFTNDLWLLDPQRDNLIRLYLQGFFQDAALRIAGLTILQALALGALGLATLWLARHRWHRAR